MRARTVLLAVALLVAGAIGGAMLTPVPAGAVSREIIEIQQTVNQLLQNQQDIRSDIDTKFASMQTLVQQSIDASGRLSTTIGSLQSTLQSAQANNGATNSNVTQAVQGVSDNMQDLEQRVAKLAQQLNDVQSSLQTITAKVSNCAAAPPVQAPTTSPMGDTGADGGAPSGATPTSSGPAPIPAGTLYSNAVADWNGGHYDIAKQEFGDYLKNFPDGPYAANAQFDLGEISYLQGDFNSAIDAYDLVIVNYPKSSRVAPAMLEKGRALAQTGKRTLAIREFRQVVARYQGSTEAKKASAALRELEH